MERVRNIYEIEQLAMRIKNKKKIVTTNGSFDILHCAHVNLLEKARQEGDVLIVLVNSDSSIQRNKGPRRPIIPENERARVLAGLRSVDYVVVFPHDKPLEYLARIKPHVHVKGGSYNPDKVEEEQALVDSWGGQCKYFEFENGFSTTSIVERIIQKHK
jgi:rfaE bifunctional protein nucleotidyltransferase chain/domain